MTRRWTIWFSALLLLSLLALLPLRIALGGLVDQGFTARQVAGTIWYGRVGELSLRARRLGTFEVRLDPGPLLLGAVELGFRRIDDPNGSLDGTLIAGDAFVTTRQESLSGAYSQQPEMHGPPARPSPARRISCSCSL